MTNRATMGSARAKEGRLAMTPFADVDVVDVDDVGGEVDVTTVLVILPFPLTWAVLVWAVAFGKKRLTPVLVLVMVSVVFTAVILPLLPLELPDAALDGVAMVVMTLVMLVVARLQKVWARLSAEERSEEHWVDMHWTSDDAKRYE